MNETTTTNTGEVAVVTFQAGAGSVVRSDEAGILDRLMTVRETLAPDLTMNELQLFAIVASRSGLDPFAKQIYAVKRQGRMTIQTGIDGYRSIAARTGEYDGQDEPTYGPNCECGRPPAHPEYATVRVYRKGVGRPFGATAFWHEYVPEAGPSGRGDQTWRKMPHVMIAKVAEALALRKAFPWDPNARTGIGGDVYTAEEMAQADAPETVTPLRERVAARVEGLTTREFADAVAEMDPERIREVRSEMFPGIASVSLLSGEARMALLARLREPVEEVVTQESDAAPGSSTEAEEPAGSRFGPESDDDAEGFSLSRARVVREDPAMVACEAASPFDAATFCLLAKGHRGAHRAGANEAWPR